ncbi:hypothetical protein [Terrabacter sp. RAF57]|uniref:hypothetical protein n=1 Tax=Terrabacter sp. RAF57 TaxID=3233063 RepID=UPI003F9E4F8B
MTTVPSELPAELLIDDLTFTDLLKIALDDVPGSSSGLWTLHGAVDPGVTLLELFAWRFEQRLYAADQVTESITRAGLRLLGVADPLPTAAATTVLGLGGDVPPTRIEAGALFTLESDTAGRQFSLVQPVSVLPVRAIEAQGELSGPGDVLELVLDRVGPRVVAHLLSVLVELSTDASVHAQWDVDAVDVPVPAALEWRALGPDGSSEPVTLDDGTCGLRRSGLLRLPWPEVWNQVGGSGCRLRATVSSGFFSEPPRVVSATPNAVTARHLVPGTADLTSGLAALLVLPHQRLTIRGTAGVLHDAPGSVTLELSEPDGQDHAWTSVADWVGVGPDDRVFLVDRARGELVFGDGLSGRVPRAASGGRAAASYALGGGTVGNLGRGGTWAQDGGAVVATNPVAATGGAEPEAIEVARQRAADALTVPDRIVTADDARQLALGTRGVAVERAHVRVGHHPGFPCVSLPAVLSVVVVPTVDRDGPVADWVPAPRPDEGLLSAVRTRLENARLLGQEVFVEAPVYRTVRVRVDVTRSAGTDILRDRVIEALTRYLDPLRGGPGEKGWPFGGAVRPSELAGVASRAVGPEVSVTNLAVELDDGEPTSCAGLAIGPGELVRIGDVVVARTDALPDGGGLR